MPQPSERSVQNHPGWYGNEKPGDLQALSTVINGKSLMLRDIEPSVMPTAGDGGGNSVQPSLLQRHPNHLHHQQQQGLPPPPQQHIDSMTNFLNGRFASSFNLQEGVDMNVSNGWSFQNQQQSVPLYRRQPQSSVPTPAQENVTLTPVHCILDGVVDKSTSGTSGAFAGYARAAVSIGLQRDITPTLPMNLQQRDILSHLSLNEQRELQSQLPAGLHQRELTQVPIGLLQRDMSAQLPVGFSPRDAPPPLSVFYPSHILDQQQVDGFVQQQPHMHHQHQHLHQQQHISGEFGKTNGHSENSSDDLLSSTQRQNGGGTTYASVLRATPQKPNSSVSPNGQEEEKNGTGDPFAVLRALGTKQMQGTSGLYHYFS